MAKNESSGSGSAPVYAINVGHIHLAVFENRSDSGRTWFNSHIVRRYKDGDQWKDSTSFSGLGDLALAAEAIKLAQKYVTGRENVQVMDDRVL